MDDAARDPVPQVATAGEYVALLRDVRRRSGLTYREIARRASAAGHWLPPSTLATMLGRTTLPRERTVLALLVACGVTAAEVEEWVEARRNLEARLSEQGRWESQPAGTAVARRRPPGDRRPERRTGSAATRAALAGASLASAGAARGAGRADARASGRCDRTPLPE
ncbi:helix-turn-helix transcriptional regulator [Micromonospora sp. M12]